MGGMSPGFPARASDDREPCAHACGCKIPPSHTKGFGTELAVKEEREAVLVAGKIYGKSKVSRSIASAYFTLSCPIDPSPPPAQTPRPAGASRFNPGSRTRQRHCQRCTGPTAERPPMAREASPLISTQGPRRDLHRCRAPTGTASCDSRTRPATEAYASPSSGRLAQSRLCFPAEPPIG